MSKNYSFRAARLAFAILVYFLMPALSIAQSTLRFTDVAFNAGELDKSFKRYNVVALDDDGAVIGNNTPVTISYKGDHAFTLRDSRILTDNHVVRIATPDGVISQTTEQLGFDGRYYTSDIINQQTACAFASFNGQYYIYVREAGQDFYLEPLTAYLPSAGSNLYVYYTPQDVQPMNATCGNDNPPSNDPPPPGGPQPEVGNCYVTELAIAMDYSMFTKYGSINAALNRTIVITNLTRVDYKTANGLQDDVNYKIVEHYLPICDTCNPWTYTSSINTNLSNIQSNGTTLFTNTFDLAQYWFVDPAFSSGTVGLAYVGVVCSGFRYNAILDYTANTNSQRCVNSHEIGHNFSCNHDVQGATIMAPTVSGSTIWSAASVSSIATHTGAVSCLGACPVVTLCDTLNVFNLSVKKDSVNKAITVKWTGTANVTYKVRLYRYATATWTAYTTVAAGVDSALFSLAAGVCTWKFKAEVIPVCPSNINGGSKMIVFSYNGVYTPAVAITTPTTNVCPGPPVTFTATGTIGTGTSFQWKINGANVGPNSSTFTTSTLNNNDVVSVVLSTNNTCTTAPTATSNSITMTVSPGVTTPVVSITASAATVCAGTPVTYTAAHNVPSPSSVSFTWYKWNGASYVPVSSGTPNTYTYTPAAGDTIYAVFTFSASGCYSSATATSNKIGTVITPAATPVVSITAAPNPVCAGQPVTYTATQNMGAATTHIWYKKSVPATFYSLAFTGGTATTYTYTPVAGDSIYCIITTTATCVTSSTATSNVIGVVVNSPAAPSVSISPSANNVCAGTLVTFTATPTNGGTTPAYQWKVNGVNAGTNSPTFSSSTFANGNVITVVLTSNAQCLTATTATSAGVTMIINPLVTPSVVISPSANPVCAGTSVLFTATPVNGGTAPVYQWKVNGVNMGSALDTFSFTPLNGNVVTCVLTTNIACPASATATSNAVVMSVTPLVTPDVSITASANNICSGIAVIFTATPVNGGTTPVYQWRVNGFNVGVNSPTYSYVPVNGNVVTCVLSSSAPCLTVPTDTSNAITMLVTPSVTPTIFIGTSQNPVCQGINVTFAALVTNAGPLPSYQWQRNGVNVGANIPNYSSTTLATGDLITCILTSNVVCPTSLTTTSNGIGMTVTPAVIPNVTISTPSAIVCAGNPTTFTAFVTNPGTAPMFQWKVNGIDSGINSPTFTSTALQNGTVITCILTSNEICAIPPKDTSNAFTIFVNPSVIPTITTSVSPAGPYNNGQTVNFTAAVTNGGTPPTITWLRNNVAIPGATGAVWSGKIGTSLQNGDVIVARLKSNILCPVPDTARSAPKTIVVKGLAIPNTTVPSGFALYPNPATDVLTLEGLQAGDELALYDARGRLVIRYVAAGGARESLSLKDAAAGIYLARFTRPGTDERWQVKVLKR